MPELRFLRPGPTTVTPLRDRTIESSHPLCYHDTHTPNRHVPIFFVEVCIPIAFAISDMHTRNDRFLDQGRARIFHLMR